MRYYVSAEIPEGKRREGTQNAAMNLYDAIDAAKDYDEIILSGGSYYLTKPVRIDNKRITLSSKEGERAALVGGIPVTGWEEYVDGIYRTRIPAVFHGLYENDVRCRSARYPKEGYLRSKGRVEEDIKASIRFDPGDLPDIPSHEPIRCFMWPGGPLGEWNWHSVDMAAAVDMSQRTLALCREARYELGTGTRYFVHHSLSLLTEPGEYFLDEENLLLYYKPLRMPIEQQEIIMPLLSNVIEVTNSSQGILRELDIRCSAMEEAIYTEMEEQDSGAVYITQSDNLLLENLRVYNTGVHGISIHGRVQNVTVTGCHIHHVGHTGIRAMGPWISDEYVNKGHVFTNNHIHHLGEAVGHSAGVQLIQCGDSRVMYNRIHHSKRYAISMKSPSLKEIRVHYPLTENAMSHQRKRYSYSRENVIAFNELYRCNTDSQDTGLIEAWCPGEYNKIQNNLIHHSDVPFSFAFAIYLDDECDYFTVENNIIHHMNQHGKGTLLSAIAVKGIGNVVRNNITAHCEVGKSGGVLWIPGRVNQGENFDVTATGNIFYQSGNGMVYCERWEPDTIKTMGDNLYYSSEGEYQFKGLYGKKGGVPFHKWTQAGYDQSSLLQNPRFMDEVQDDYRLMYDSPAFKGSCRDIHLRDIGLTARYRMETPEPMERLFVWVEGHGSYHVMKTGEARRLYCMARTENGLPVQPEEPVYTVEGDSVRIDPDGTIHAAAQGISKIIVQAEDVSTAYYVLVDDRVESLELLVLEENAVLGAKWKMRVVGRTRYGRTVHPRSFEIHSDHNMVIGDTLAFIKAGTDRLSISADFGSQIIHDVHVWEVKEDVLRDFTVTLPSAAYVGEPVQAEITGMMHSGKTVCLKQADLRADHAVLQGDQIILNAAGEHTLEFSIGSICETRYVMGVEKSPIPEGWQCKSYGEATGLVYCGMETALFSNGKNIWYQADDFTYYHRWIPREETVEVEMTIYSLDEIDIDTQCGILLRAEDTQDSRCINLRITPEGKIMLCARLENGAEMKPYAGALSSCRFGGCDEESLGALEGAAGRDNRFPVTLRLSYSQGRAEGYIKAQDEDIKLGEVMMDLPPLFMAGAALFSIDTSHCAASRFNIQIR